jgi:hypothetical protein
MLVPDYTMHGQLSRVSEEALAKLSKLLPWLDKNGRLEDFRAGKTISTAEQWGTAPTFSWKAHQLAFLGESMHQERGISGGGTLADTPGNGKALQGLGQVVVDQVHDRNVSEVRAEWDTGKSSKHLPRDAGVDETCLSFTALRCYCEPGARRDLYKERPASDITLVIAPQNALSAFATDARRILEGSALMNSILDDDPEKKQCS